MRIARMFTAADKESHFEQTTMRRWQGLVLLLVALWPAQALALPTPDAVIGSVQMLPVLLGAVGAAAAWAGRKLWRLLGGHKDARRPLATMAIVFGVGFV